MASIDKKGKPVKINFFDVFVTDSQRQLRKSKRRTPLVATKNSDAASTAAAPPSPTSEAANTWTAVEDAALLGMKAQQKSWTAMSEMLPGKGVDGIKERYSELYKKVPDKFKAKGASKKESDEGKVEEKPKEVEKKASKASVKGNSMSEKGNVKEDEPKKINGRPVIWIEAGDPLSTEEMGNLYIWNARYEEKKWIELASRFFDKTGKRINPDVLKEKLKNV